MSLSDMFKAKKFKEEIEQHLEENLKLKRELEALKVEKITNFELHLKENSKLKEELEALKVEKITNLELHLEENSKLKKELETLKAEKIADFELYLEDNAKLIKELETLKTEKITNMELYLEETSKLRKEIETLEEEISFLKTENERYKSILTDDHNKAIEIKAFLEELVNKEFDLKTVISEKQDKVSELENDINNLKKGIIVLNDEILYQSFGLYTPLYDFINSEQYKHKLDEIRMNQKNMIKNKTAVICSTKWEVNGSKAQGTKMTNDNIKQILRSFNSECENVINRVKFNNYDSMRDRITKAYETLNKLNETNAISIQWEFLELKYEELSIAHEYQLKKQEEKDEQRILREQRREEAKVAKEIEERRKEIEKEEKHYNNVLKRLDDQISVEKSEERLHLLIKKRNEVVNNLADLDLALKEIDYREANQRAGYVYVISNIGAFGKNVYKIGMTRRLEPQDRVDELGSASVPFKFDINAMMFSEDAPKLENALHRSFESKKINMMNNRKEFFNVTIEEIEEVVKANYDKTVEFIRTSPAQQYRESLKIKETLKGPSS